MCTGNTTNTHTTHRIEYMRTYGQNERWATVKLWRRARDDSTNATEWAHARWVSRTKRWMAMQTATGAPTETNNGNVFFSSLSITVRVSLSGEERERAPARERVSVRRRERAKAYRWLSVFVFFHSQTTWRTTKMYAAKRMERNGERERARRCVCCMHLGQTDDHNEQMHGVRENHTRHYEVVVVVECSSASLRSRERVCCVCVRDRERRVVCGSLSLRCMHETLRCVSIYFGLMRSWTVCAPCEWLQENREGRLTAVFIAG